MELREKLCDLRKEHRISQLEVAEKLGVSRQTVSRWETGTSVPTTENLMRLSTLYGVPLDVWLREGWAPSDLSEPLEAVPELSIPEPPAQEPSTPKNKMLLRRPTLKAVLLAVVLAVGIAIGIWFSHRNDGKVISTSEMEGEAIDLTTLGKPIIGLPPTE